MRLDYLPNNLARPRSHSGHGRGQILVMAGSRFWSRPGPDSGHGMVQILVTAASRFWSRACSDSGRGRVQILVAAGSRFWSRPGPESGLSPDPFGERRRARWRTRIPARGPLRLVHIFTTQNQRKCVLANQVLGRPGWRPISGPGGVQNPGLTVPRIWTRPWPDSGLGRDQNLDPAESRIWTRR